MKKIKVKITFTEEVLGTANPIKDIHGEYIASKAPGKLSREEEIEAVGAADFLEKSTTIFPRDAKGSPVFWDYQWKGFFKDACASLIRGDESLSHKAAKTAGGELRAFKKIIDGCIFVFPRMISIKMNGKMDTCSRPLRAFVGSKEVTALATSESVPAGSSCNLEVHCLNGSHEKFVREWLDYGKLRGMGQWRNSGKGRFEVKYLK